MEVELHYASDDNPTLQPAAAAADEDEDEDEDDTTGGVSVNEAAVAVLVVLAVSLALDVRSYLKGDYDPTVGFAFIVFVYLNLALQVCALRSLFLAPEGSPAHGRAKFVAWLLVTMLVDAVIWKIGEELPRGLVVAVWVVAAVMHVGGFYLIFVFGDESLSFLRDCEKDGGDLSVLAS